MAAFEEVPREYYHYILLRAPRDARRMPTRTAAEALGDRLRLGAVGLSRSGLHDPDLPAEAGATSRWRSAPAAASRARCCRASSRRPTRSRSSSRWATRWARSSRRSATTTSHTKVGDGYYGWPEVEGGFDIIIVTCAAQYAPPDLFKQLKPGGRMIIPIGQPFKRGQVLYVYTKDAEGKVHSQARHRRVLHPDDRRDDEAAAPVGRRARRAGVAAGGDARRGDGSCRRAAVKARKAPGARRSCAIGCGCLRWRARSSARQPCAPSRWPIRLPPADGSCAP